MSESLNIEGNGKMADVLIASANHENFLQIFIGERKWKPIRMQAKRLEYLKWIAVYQTAPVSAITCYAKILEIDDTGPGGRYIIKTSEPIYLERPMKSGSNSRAAIQGHRFTDLESLIAAESIDCLKPWL